MMKQGSGYRRLRRKLTTSLVVGAALLATAGAADAFLWAAAAANLNASSTRTGLARNYGTRNAAINAACFFAGSPCGYRTSTRTGGTFVVNTSDGFGGGIWASGFGYPSTASACTAARTRTFGWPRWAYRCGWNV